MTTAVAAALIAGGALAAYANTFGVPFVFDDEPSILQNPGIRHLWPIWDAFRPQAPASTVDGRPFANFTLAINYAISGTDVWSYHVVNLLIHIGAGLALFGIVRRTLVIVGRHRRMPPMGNSAGWLLSRPGGARYGDPALQRDATALAFAIALLWTLHPLQTEAVTYVVQRVESLMGLFYLLTLYCFLRGVEASGSNSGAGSREQGEGNERRNDRRPETGDWRQAEAVPPPASRLRSPKPLPLAPCPSPLAAREVGELRSRTWFALGFLACLLGMATKEVMVTAPVMVLLYDRTFVAGTFREAWRRRWKVHLSLASTWLLLAALVAGTGWNRGGAAGFDVGVTPWNYWLTQFEAVVRYLGLIVWPHPQVFDYGTFFYGSLAAVWWQALLVLVLLGFAVIALYKKPAAGFLGAWFFGILAVTSGVPGTIQMVVEHRLYLPLAAVVAVLVLGVNHLLRRFGDRGPKGQKTKGPKDQETSIQKGPFVFWSHGPLVPWSFGLLVFSSALPFGLVTFKRNSTYCSELSLWQDTVAKRPDSPRAHNALAFALDHLGRTAEAIAEFHTALRLAPDNADLHDNLGVTLAGAGRTAEAIAQFETALRLRPAFPTALCNLGNALVQAGRPAEAVPQYEHALRLKPGYADAEYNLAGALDLSRRPADALPHLEAAVRLKPDFASARYNLAELLDRLGRPADAIAHYEQALRLDPGMARAHAGLGVVLCKSGQTDAGLAHLREAVRLQPDDASAHFNLGVALMRAGRGSEAAPEFESVLRLRPGDTAARRALDQIRAAPPRAAGPGS